MPEPTGWFFDSVTLSNFALAGAMSTIENRYRSRGHVATQVVDELTQGVVTGYTALTDCLALVDSAALSVVALNKAERRTFRQLVTHLGQGEAGTIAAAHHRGGIVVTDDLAARRTCTELRVPITGTIGILRVVVRDREMPLATANDLLRKMIASGFRSPVVRLSNR